ncbi:hypothetical protein N783_01080 [Pontibacillus marinus BH030004 = DSM 16465]|uniref:Uncharacterized protein n=1 Tax=Pontibacillus marinus BH030004 = DSM 16465 TaxID=1385511 RepID=A0A0A5I2N7_9BACI|nr:hypothetical protein N783_01080 [Pontibacillus marinus BH030004 = DSM 16465]
MRDWLRHFFLFWRDIDGNFSWSSIIMFIVAFFLPTIYFFIQILEWLGD